MQLLQCGKYEIDAKYFRLPSSFIFPSVSPSEFLATQRYVPKSLGPTARIFNFMYFV